MCKVKQFAFPSYEDWTTNYKYEFVTDIGEFRVKVAKTAFGCNGNTKNTYEIGLSIYENPTNIYTPKLYHECLSCDYFDDKKKQRWYDRVTKECNEFFEQHILSYFEECKKDD